MVKAGHFKEVYLRVTNDSQHNVHQFAYSTDGSHYAPIGLPFAMRAGYWKGIRVGLFCYGDSGKAHFDFFRQTQR